LDTLVPQPDTKMDPGAIQDSTVICASVRRRTKRKVHVEDQ